MRSPDRKVGASAFAREEREMNQGVLTLAWPRKSGKSAETGHPLDQDNVTRHEVYLRDTDALAAAVRSPVARSTRCQGPSAEHDNRKRCGNADHPVKRRAQTPAAFQQRNQTRTRKNGRQGEGANGDNHSRCECS